MTGVCLSECAGVATALQTAYHTQCTRMQTHTTRSFGAPLVSAAAAAAACASFVIVHNNHSAAAPAVDATPFGLTHIRLNCISTDVAACNS